MCHRSIGSELLQFQQYRQLHLRTAKTLWLLEDSDEYSEDEQRKIAGQDWTEDCHRYDIRADGGLTMTMFFASMYQLVDLWASDFNVSFFVFMTRLFDNVRGGGRASFPLL